MIRTLVLQETWIRQGSEVLQVCWDLEKFYDDISVIALCVSAARLGYQPTLLTLAVLSFLGPRSFTQNSVASEFVQVTNSIVQGDAQSNNCARAVLYDVLDHLTSAFPQVHFRQFVDDLQQMVEVDPGAPQEAVGYMTQSAID
eukprot:12815722-Alexandrium_andersonii.AAC.1